MSPLVLGLAGLATGWLCARASFEGGRAENGDRPSATRRLSTASLTRSADSSSSATPGGVERPPSPAATGLDAFVADSLGAPASAAPKGAALARRTEEVAALLRCPVCQGTSVADSPSTMARTMKAQVRSLLAQGFDEEQVLRYFELSYGESVRTRPKAEGLTALLWGLPLAFVAIGVLVLARAALRLQRRRPAPP